MQNNNPQTPPNQQVPDHRLDQLTERLRTMELQNSQLRGQIDNMARSANPQANQPPKQSAFQPEVQKAITELVEEKLQAERQNHRQQIGYLADQLDQTKFQAQYGGEKYSKLLPKVDQLRQEYQAKNQYITREQALQMVYFEETGKKGMAPDPAAPPAPAPVAPPVYDRYLNQWVDPTTGQPVQPTPVQALQDESIEPQVQPPAQAWQPPQPAQQPNPQFGQVPPGARMQPGQNMNPMVNPFGQNNFQLPGQGVNNPAPAHNQASGAHRGPLNLESADADLEAFEARFGDIPL